ncbi:hypothetical protein MPER_08568 [Moniliophthora perniciosa FA553]|nr:hypothetical protein MPER_08568 [Moniliophthora perniciosa FA553]
MTRHSSRHPTVTLYDIPGSSPQPWAPNIWRIRFILNYKRIKYSTVWVEFPDVEAELRAIGAPPSSVRSDGRPVYTLPVLVDPGRNPSAPVILSNTNNICEYLEATYPSRPVFPVGSRAVQTLFVHYIQEVAARITYVRKLLLGYPGSLPPGPQREQAWLAAKEQFDFLALVLAKNTGDGDGTVCSFGSNEWRHMMGGLEFGLGTEDAGSGCGSDAGPTWLTLFHLNYPESVIMTLTHVL